MNQEEYVNNLKKELVGRNIKTAQSLYNIRIVKQDGESFFTTLEYYPDRINVEVVKGVIVDIVSLG